jgi:hypothetical protein
MVWLRPPTGDQFVAHLAGEGNIHQPVAMHMADLTFADAEFCPAESMRLRRYPWPTRHYRVNTLVCALHCHKFTSNHYNTLIHSLSRKYSADLAGS